MIFLSTSVRNILQDQLYDACSAVYYSVINFVTAHECTKKIARYRQPRSWYETQGSEELLCLVTKTDAVLLAKQIRRICGFSRALFLAPNYVMFNISYRTNCSLRL